MLEFIRYLIIVVINFLWTDEMVRYKNGKEYVKKTFPFHLIPVAHRMATRATAMARKAKAHKESSVPWRRTWELLAQLSTVASSSGWVDVRMSARFSARMRTDMRSSSLSIARRRFSSDVVLRKPTLKTKIKQWRKK